MVEDRELLLEIHSQTYTNTAILARVLEEQEKTNGRLTKVEADGLMVRGGILVLSFLMTVGIAVAGIVVLVV